MYHITLRFFCLLQLMSTYQRCLLLHKVHLCARLLVNNIFKLEETFFTICIYKSLRFSYRSFFFKIKLTFHCVKGKDVSNKYNSSFIPEQ